MRLPPAKLILVGVIAIGIMIAGAAAVQNFRDSGNENDAVVEEEEQEFEPIEALEPTPTVVVLPPTPIVLPTVTLTPVPTEIPVLQLARDGTPAALESLEWLTLVEQAAVAAMRSAQSAEDLLTLELTLQASDRLRFAAALAKAGPRAVTPPLSGYNREFGALEIITILYGDKSQSLGLMVEGLYAEAERICESRSSGRCEETIESLEVIQKVQERVNGLEWRLDVREALESGSRESGINEVEKDLLVQLTLAEATEDMRKKAESLLEKAVQAKEEMEWVVEQINQSENQER